MAVLCADRGRHQSKCWLVGASPADASTLRNTSSLLYLTVIKIASRSVQFVSLDTFLASIELNFLFFKPKLIRMNVELESISGVANTLMSQKPSY